MTALSQDRNTERRLGDQCEDPVKGATKIYGGSMVCLDANGKAVPASDTAGLKIRGVSQQQVDNLLGADDALTVLTRKDGWHLFGGSGFTDADIGKPVYVADDQTVQIAVTTNKVIAGHIRDVESATAVWIEIASPAGELVAAVTQANAADQGVGYVEADVDSIASLANANKIVINNLITALKNAGVIASS